MDPFTLCLIFSAIIVKLWRVDAQYAKQGKTPPGYGLIDKWLEGRKARGQAPADARPARYGMWRYFWQRWAATWELASHAHELRHRARLKELADAAERGELPPAGTDRPTLKQQIAAAWQWVIEPHGGDDPKSAVPTPTEPATPATTPGDSPVAEPATATADGPVITCDECGAALVDAHGGHKHPDGSACGKAWLPAGSQSAGSGKPVAASTTIHPVDPSANSFDADPEFYAAIAAGNAEYEAQEAQRRRAINKAEGDDMPATQSGEVTGIPSAVHYLEQMAAVHQEHADNEALVAALGEMKVGSGDLGLVQAAMTRSAEAAELYQNAATKLAENNRGVRESYGSAPDAADKFANLAS